MGRDIVHQYVGQEPSGLMFNELSLDANSENKQSTYTDSLNDVLQVGGNLFLLLITCSVLPAPVLLKYVLHTILCISALF